MGVALGEDDSGEAGMVRPAKALKALSSRRIGLVGLALAGAIGVLGVPDLARGQRSAPLQAVAFTLPGTMINIPTASHVVGPDFLKVGFITELRGFTGSKIASGIYMDFEPSAKSRLGLTILSGPEIPPGITEGDSIKQGDPQFGFHMQRTLFTFETMAIAAGVADIVFREKTEDDQTFLRSEIGLFSFYAVVSREQRFNGTSLRWYVGMGTDRFGPVERETTQPGVFAGIEVSTEYLKRAGGVRILGEFDGRGINLGTTVPISRDYSATFALTQVQKINNLFSEEKFIADLNDGVRSAGIAVGLAINFPRRVPELIVERPTALPRVPVTDLPPEALEAALFPPEIPEGYVTPEEVEFLRDSLRVSERNVETLSDMVAFLEQRNRVLQDSVQVVKGDRFALEQNINQALRSLSRSLRYYYRGEYRAALEEVESAIEYNPSLSLAYARRGSIYYKLGNMERAVLNWNVALQLDPEYEDVRNILRAMGEGRLRTASLRQ